MWPCSENVGSNLACASALTRALVQVTLKRQGVTIPGQVQRIKGEGMPKHEDESKYGDLLVTYKVVFPTELSQEQKDVIIKTLK